MAAPSDPVDRAQAFAQARRDKRQEIVNSLPDVRNQAANLRYGEKRPRKPPNGYSKKRQAEAIRDWSKAETLNNYGRSRMSMIRAISGGTDATNVGEQLKERLSKRQWRRFQELASELTRGTYQAIALHFRYAGGQDYFTLIIERLLYPKNDPNEGLDMLESLVEQAERAARLYAPSVIGRIRV